MSTEKMQEEFEEWASMHRMPLHKDGVVVTYAARCTDEAWQAWQASRAALVIELPPVRSSFGEDWNENRVAVFTRDDAFAAIEAAGFRVKS